MKIANAITTTALLLCSLCLSFNASALVIPVDSHKAPASGVKLFPQQEQAGKSGIIPPGRTLPPPFVSNKVPGNGSNNMPKTGVEQATVNSVPIPATLMLFGLGLASLAWARRKNCRG